jgi:hypothetical protein
MISNRATPGQWFVAPPKNDTLTVSLNSGNAFVYPVAGDNIVRWSGDGTKNIHDAPARKIWNLHEFRLQ